MIEGVDRLLAPYGGAGAYGRDRHPSDYLLMEKLRGVKSSATVIPAIFLAVAAFLLNVVMSRTVTTGAAQNMNINFDDEAGGAYASIPCPPTNAGNFKPIESLSPFEAEEINGTWTLRVLDNDGIDAGTLNSWGLEFCYLALPVEWLSFTAALSDENTALLAWSTATEQDNRGFRIERSVGNALDFAPIGWVPGSGDSRETRHYSFTDSYLLPGLTHYYRLSQEDEDGSRHFSKVESVAPRSAAGQLRLSPNPVGNLLYIALPGKPEMETLLVSLWDASGRKVLEERISADQPLDVSQLPAGAYQVQVLEAEGVWNGRMVRH